MRAKDYQAILNMASNIMGEAMHVVTSDGKSIVYNEEMAKLEKVSVKDVLGKVFREAFAFIPEEQSTLWKALTKNEPTVNKEQTYFNAYGKKVTTVNTTMPIEVDGKVVAAIEVAKDITDIKNMSDTILSLQENRRAGRVKVNVDEDESKLDAQGRPKIKKYTFESLNGENPIFKAELARAKRAAENDVNVLIYGETGTGKELFAQSIHYASPRQNKPFLAQNCAALPESLLEGILFGTTKGGFTGAVDRAGLFEQADGGTLLLDEVNAMPYELQGKLLRVLQEDNLRRVGGSRDIPFDVRIIATINEPAEQLIEQGKLRRDLYYRLNIVNLEIPPLRERKSDIPLLAKRFMEKNNIRYNKQVWMISDEALQKLQDYDYPGNVRELENIIMAAISLAGDEHVLSAEDININRSYRATSSKVAEFSKENATLTEYLENIEKTVIQQHLVANDGNVSKTAKDLGLVRQNLQHKIKKYKL